MTGLKKNLHCLDLETRKNMIDNNCKNLRIAKQCDLLLINKSTYYYKARGWINCKRHRNNENY